MSTTTLLRLPDLQGQSFDVYFRYDEFGADTHSPPHTHAWGQLNYAAHGVMQLEIDGQRFLSPPQYAVWIPPERVHSCYNSQAIVYRSLYLSAELSRRLPATPCTLAISAILKAILSDFAERGSTCRPRRRTCAWPGSSWTSWNAPSPTTTTCPTAVPRRCARCSTHCRPSRATTARWRNGRSRCTAPSEPWPGTASANWA